jgi:hypothetical protein
MGSDWLRGVAPVARATVGWLWAWPLSDHCLAHGFAVGCVFLGPGSVCGFARKYLLNSASRGCAVAVGRILPLRMSDWSTRRP